jgi:hypothetical protein
LQAQTAAGTEALRRILDQKAKLARMLANLEFRLDETILERTMLEEEIIDDKPKPAAGTSQFFALLNQMEAEEAAIKTKISTKEEKIRDLLRYNRNLNQQNDEARRKLELKSNRLAALQHENQSLHDQTVDITTRIISRRAYYQELVAVTSKLTRELESQTENIAGSTQIVDRLRSENARLKELLETRKREQNDVTRKLAESVRVAELRQKQSEDALKTALSLRTWQAPRGKLTNTLILAKKQREAVLKTLDVATRRDHQLTVQIMELLKNDDPGDATGLTALKIVKAEIDECEIAIGKAANLEIEEDYASELEQQTALVSKTRRILDEWHARAVNELKEELHESMDKGYLELLAAENNQLKASVARP